MDLELTRKTAIVTGASRGIGRAIALALAKEGMRLVLTARDALALADVADAAGGDVLVQACDLRAPDAPAAVVAAAVARFGGVDLVVNNAGATKRGDFFALTDEDFVDGFALKYFAHVRLLRAAWPWLVRSAGCVVQVVGVGGRTPGAEFAIGGSVNAALMALTKTMAARGMTDGVRVCAVNPGSIATERLERRIAALAAERGVDRDGAAAALAESLGVTRFGTPAEIAAVVAFLASPRASFVQGAIVDVDGGATRTL